MEINGMNAFLGGSTSVFITLLRDEEKRGVCDIGIPGSQYIPQHPFPGNNLSN